MKPLGELNVDETYALQGTQPWRVKSPSGKNLPGLTVHGVKLKNAANENASPESMELMFLTCNWAIKVGFQLINFAVKCGVLNLLKK